MTVQRKIREIVLEQIFIHQADISLHRWLHAEVCLFFVFFSSKGIKRGEWKWSSYFWCIPWCLQSSYPRDLTCAFAVLSLCQDCTTSVVSYYIYVRCVLNQSWPLLTGAPCVCVSHTFSLSSCYSTEAESCWQTHRGNWEGCKWMCGGGGAGGSRGCWDDGERVRGASRQKQEDLRDVTVYPREQLCQRDMTLVTLGEAGGCPFADRWTTTYTLTHMLTSVHTSI